MASEGDPRVLFVMNLVLSVLFSLLLVGGLSAVGVLEFTPTAMAATTVFLMVVTWLVVLR